MKVGIDIQCLTRPLTGVGYYVLGLLKGLASLPRADTIVPFYFSRGGSVDLPSSVYRRLQVSGRRLPGRLLSLGWKTIGFPPVSWLVRGMDVYHFPDFIARPAGRKPVVATVYDLSFRVHPEYTEPRNLKYLSRHLPRTLDRADRVIAISEFTKSELMRFYPVPEERISVIYGGVDDEFRRPSSPALVQKVKYRYNLPDKFVLTVATWEPRKNLSGLLKAWSHLREEGLLGDYKLLLIGMKGWLFDRIERQFRGQTLKGVKALGYVPRAELPAIYRASSLFVFPSFYEGQGLPPLEALAAGVPVAASSAGSLPEVLGEAAVYFDPANPEDIARSILLGLTDQSLRSRLREAGPRQAAPFTWGRTAEETLKAYRRAGGLE